MPLIYYFYSIGLISRSGKFVDVNICFLPSFWRDLVTLIFPLVVRLCDTVEPLLRKNKYRTQRVQLYKLEDVELELPAMVVNKCTCCNTLCPKLAYVLLSSQTDSWDFFYSCWSHMEHRASVKRFVSLQFLNLRQSIGLLRRRISP
jgi:hypothetical protein